MTKRKTKVDPKTKTTAMSAALAVAGVVQNVGLPVVVNNGVQHAADVFKSNTDTVFSNPMEYIDELNKHAPFWGNVALRVLCSAIGWYAVNTILWDFRKRNQAPKFNSGIDWLNDSIAEIKEKEQNVQAREDQGHSTLEFVDGNKFIGAYKYLFMLVTSSGETGTFEVPSPAVLYERMRQKGADRENVLASYETFEMERFKNSPNFKYMKDRLERNKAASDVREQRKAQQEIDHIHEELRAIKYEVFDDGVWARLPLWAQFKLMRSVHKQIIAAIANEMEKPADERVHLHDLNNLGETVLLELEAANRDAEVKLAFEKGVLKIENHAL